MLRRSELSRFGSVCTARADGKVTSARASTQVADLRSSNIACVNSPPSPTTLAAGAHIPPWPPPSLLQPFAA